MANCTHPSTTSTNVGTATLVVCDTCDVVVCGIAN